MKLPEAARAAIESEIESHRQSIDELEKFLKANGVNPQTDAQKASHSAKIKAGIAKKKKAAAAATANTTAETPSQDGENANPTAVATPVPTPGPKAVVSKPAAVTGKLPGKPAGVPLAPSQATPEPEPATVGS